MALLRVRLRAKPYPWVLGSDSSDTHYCLGMTRSSERGVYEALKWDERWKLVQGAVKEPTKKVRDVEALAMKATQELQTKEEVRVSQQFGEVLKITQKTPLAIWVKDQLGLRRGGRPPKDVARPSADATPSLECRTAP